MPEMKTTTDALRWALGFIQQIADTSQFVFLTTEESEFTRAKEILTLSEFVESVVAPDYSKDGGFDMLIDTTPASYAIPEQQ